MPPEQPSVLVLVAVDPLCAHCRNKDEEMDPTHTEKSASQEKVSDLHAKKSVFDDRVLTLYKSCSCETTERQFGKLRPLVEKRVV